MSTESQCGTKICQTKDCDLWCRHAINYRLMYENEKKRYDEILKDRLDLEKALNTFIPISADRSMAYFGHVEVRIPPTSGWSLAVDRSFLLNVPEKDLQELVVKQTQQIVKQIYDALMGALDRAKEEAK